MHDFILESIVPITVYLMLGCWWIIWLSYRNWNPINLDKILFIVFFGHLLLSIVAYTIYLIVEMIRDLTPIKLKTWLFKEWK